MDYLREIRSFSESTVEADQLVESAEIMISELVAANEEFEERLLTERGLDMQSLVDDLVGSIQLSQSRQRIRDIEILGPSRYSDYLKAITPFYLKAVREHEEAGDPFMR